MLLNTIKLQATLFFEKYFLARDIEHVYSLLGGPIFFQSMRSAVELGLFDFLQRSEHVTFSRLMGKFEMEAQPLRILLTNLIYLKLIKKTGQIYVNTRISKICFCNDSPKNLIEIVRWQHSINYQAMYYFLDSLKENKNIGLQVIPGKGDTLYERLSQNKSLETIFQNAMVQISRQANYLLKEFVPFGDLKSVVDVGGGIGENLINLGSRWPHLKGCVFDLPSVCKRAQENFDRIGSKNLTTHAGNCFDDPFPLGHDAFLFCHFLTIWSKEKNIKLLKKAYNSLEKNGRVIIFNMMQNNSENGPSGAALGSPYFQTLATGEGMLYTWQDYEKMLHAAGFGKVEVMKLPSQHGVLIGIK